MVAAGTFDEVIGVDRHVRGELPGVSLHQLDLTDPGSEEEMAKLCSGASAVVHLAFSGADHAEEANRVSLEAAWSAARDGGAEVFVEMSSATVYGAWTDNPRPLSEDQPLRPNPGFAYAEEKAEAERLLTAEAGSGTPRLVLLRPVLTVGQVDHPLFKALSGMHTPGPDEEGRVVQYLHVDDLADAVLLAAGGSLEGPYNVAPDLGIDDQTARELTGGVANIRLPPPLAGRLAGLRIKLGRSRMPLQARPYTEHNWVVSPDRIKEAGWEPRYSTEEALVATDERVHWDDLPPGKRQNFTLLVVIVSVVAAAAGGGALAWWLIRRQRARS